MSIISRIFLKIRVALFGGPDHDIIFDTDDEYDIPHTPNKDVQSYLDRLRRQGADLRLCE